MPSGKTTAIAVLLLAAASCPVLAQNLNVLHPDGLYTERVNGMSYPAAVGDFQRVNVIKYNPDGSDESGGYNRLVPGAEIAATIYVFPSPGLTSIDSSPEVVADTRARLCEQRFYGVEGEVTRAHPDAERLSEEPVTLDQEGVTFRGFRASYKLVNRLFFGRGQVASRSDAYLFCYAGGKWAVEYRFDYPLGYDAGDEIAAFMRDLKWTLGTHI